MKKSLRLVVTSISTMISLSTLGISSTSIHLTTSNKLLAQEISNSPTVTSLAEIQKQVSTFEKTIEQLNTQLEKVVGKTIDREEIDFKLIKVQLRAIRKDWDTLKEQLEMREKLTNFVEKTEINFTDIESILTPLDRTIIQSLEQFENRKPIDELKKYQGILFGQNATQEEVDGLFGSGTKHQIELLLMKNLC
ncbi:MAG: hypothetical protein AAGF26_15955, partial [Cyanobacteria bacterium P01_G01_bin.49]